MRTNIRSINFKSSNGADTVSAVVYFPEGKPMRGIIQVCHGMCEHIGRYHDLLLELAHLGFAACAHDQLGHGKTASCPQALGFFSPKNGYQFLLHDTYQLSQIVMRMFPDRKLFLLGHSMGSLVARLCSVKYAGLYAGALFFGTPAPNSMTSMGMLLAQRTIKKEGPMYRPPLLQRMTIENMNKRFVPARTGSDWLSRDDAVVDRYMADPLCGFVFTASAFYDLYAMLEIASSQKWVRDYPKELPTRICSGDCDPVGGFGRGVLQIYNRLLSAGVEDLTLQLYPGARHELFNELNREEVVADLVEWLESRI